MSSDNVVVEMQKLSASYRAKPVLKGIDWRWQRGEQWACLGLNGAGKTSLARVLTGDLSHSGKLLISTAPSDKNITYVCFEQQSVLCERDRKLDQSEFRSDASDPGTTVRAAITSAGGDKALAKLAPWINQLRMDAILDRGLRFISTGEMRKTLILRALASEPGLLILDNPLDGLDAASRANLSELLEALLGTDLAVLLLCREGSDIPAACSQVMVLKQGRVIAAGPRHRVLSDTAVHDLLEPPAANLGQPPAPSRPSDRDTTGALIHLAGVSVRYGDHQVLHDVHWTVEPGQHWCIAGPNGCGKSTLLSLLTGANHKAYGQNITLFGRRRGSGESVQELQQQFGLLDTHTQLSFGHGSTVLETVVSGFFSSMGLYDDWTDTQRRRALQWLEALALQHLSGQAFDTLSFGIQRLILLARAVVKAPRVLILDEPCLGLDGPHRRRLLAAVDHIARTTDTQILYVSHSPGSLPECISHLLTFEYHNNGYRCAPRQRSLNH
jgi:molybdate transport system ATP-binding protein